MKLKLYGHDTSPYVRRIRVLLAEKGLPFKRDTASWSAPGAEVLRINPLLRVPALVDETAGADGAQTLLDSKLIATYLYDRYPQVPSAPPGHLPLQATLFDPTQRYDDENLLVTVDGAADSAINLFVLELDGVKREQAPYLQRQAQRIESCLRYLDDRLGGRATLHDDVLSFTDIALVCHFDWMLFRDRYPVRKHENLARFLDAHRDRPSLIATHPSKATSTALPKTPAAR
jgi:glutathione S-transferase